MREVGAERIEVIGNLKFDIELDEALVERGHEFRQSAGGRSVLLFAVTREGEEELLLAALEQCTAGARTDALLIIVPRHPQRFDQVAAMIEARGYALSRRSSMVAWRAPGPSENAVVLGDSMGEMAMYYASCDVAIIGGSLLPLGGQNLIEACAVGVPVVVGPHTFNFAQATDDAVAVGAARRVGDARSAVDAMWDIATDSERRSRMGDAATKFARQHRGATARAIGHIVPLLKD
jgi:3-deoxy-D-manno-octulosonic-acid transferase